VFAASFRDFYTLEVILKQSPWAGCKPSSIIFRTAETHVHLYTEKLKCENSINNIFAYRGKVLSSITFHRLALSEGQKEEERMKATKTNIAVISVALFLLVFPFAARPCLILPPPIPHYVVTVEFNDYVNPDSEEFKRYFIENLTAIDSGFPEADLNLTDWSRNYVATDIEWTCDLSIEEKDIVADRIAEAFLNQWYTQEAKYIKIIGTPIPPDFVLKRVMLICWSTSVALLIVMWYWRKIKAKQ
jgi:hypothetical protein